ncbi:MAG: hypothetical protein LBH93_08500, partial [Chitinispirillales bacterium]|nr:hypothetical protein [Chitinispirillales bacterium]
MGKAGLIAALALAVVFPLFADGVSGPPPARYRIGGVSIEGLPDEPEVPDAILMSVPLYYDAGAVRRVIAALSRLLSDSGYPYNRISTEVSVDGPEAGGAAADSATAAGAPVSDTAVTIRFTVDHGERVCAGRPLIIGSRGAKKFFYYDVRFAAGGFYSGREVDEAVRRLSFRPYVEKVAASPPVIIEGAPLCRGSLQGAVVAFSVTGRSAVEVEGALGYESGRGGASGL